MFYFVSKPWERSASVLTTAKAACTTICDCFIVDSRFPSQFVPFCQAVTSVTSFQKPLFQDETIASFLAHLGKTIYFQIFIALLQTMSEENYLEENSRQHVLQNLVQVVSDLWERSGAPVITFSKRVAGWAFFLLRALPGTGTGCPGRW